MLVYIQLTAEQNPSKWLPVRPMFTFRSEPDSLQFKDDFAQVKASNSRIITPQRSQNRQTETPVGLKPTVIQSRKINLEITKEVLPLKSPFSLQSFCISSSIFSVREALYFLLAPRKISSPVAWRFMRKLRSNGLKLSRFDLSFNCCKVCKKMQISQVREYMLIRLLSTLGRLTVAHTIGRRPRYHFELSN